MNAYSPLAVTEAPEMPDNADDTRLVTILLIIIGVFVIFPVFFIGFGMTGLGPMMGGMWGGGTMTGWLFIVGIVMRLLFLAALVGGGYLIYRAVVGRESDADHAVQELRLAYARGDLSDEEYEQRKNALEQDT